MNSGMSNYLDSGQTPAIGQWQYLTATFDGSTARYYIDGTQVASRSVGYPIGSSNVWRIGAYASPRDPASSTPGLIDDVRVYDRAQRGRGADRHDLAGGTFRGRHDTADGADKPDADRDDHSSVSLTWGAAIDNRGVYYYDVYRGTSSGFTPTLSQPHRNGERDELHRFRTSRRAPTTTKSRPRTPR